jgi:hypothetical protein
VKLSDALVLDARVTGDAQQRSIARQVEFWARLGQVTEQMLDGRRIQVLRSKGAIESLADAIGTIDKPKGRVRLKQYLDSLPFPHFEQHPEHPDLLIRTEENGKRTVGRFVNREFVEAVKSSKAPSRRARISRPSNRALRSRSKG